MFLGLLLVFLGGITWNAEGIGVSWCAAKKVSFDMVQGWLFLFCLVISLITAVMAGDFSGNPPDVLLRTFLCMFLAGIAVFFTFVMAERAMAKGPNGLVWGIMQAGMIGSFLMGIFLFGEEPVPVRVAGLAVIIGGMFCMGADKDSSGKTAEKKEWLPAALGAFFFVAVSQCLCSYPSFVPELAKTTPMFRSIGMFSGGLFGFVLFSLPRQIRKHAICSKSILIIAGVLVIEKLLANYLLIFPGIDILAEHHAGGLGYPVAIGVCVGGFSLYSLIILKEKISKTGLAGLCAVLIGIVLISLK